jgi:hypothetical protein
MIKKQHFLKCILFKISAQTNTLLTQSSHNNSPIPPAQQQQQATFYNPSADQQPAATSSAPNTAIPTASSSSTTSYFNNIGNQPAAQFGAAQNNLSTYTGANLPNNNTTSSANIQSAPIQPPGSLNPLMSQLQTNFQAVNPMNPGLGNSLNTQTLGQQQQFGAPPNLLLPPRLTTPITSTPTNPQIPNAMFNQPPPQGSTTNQFILNNNNQFPSQQQQFNPTTLSSQFSNQIRQNTPPVVGGAPLSNTVMQPPPTPTAGQAAPGLQPYRPPGLAGAQLPPPSNIPYGQYRPSTLPPPPSFGAASTTLTTNPYQPTPPPTVQGQYHPQLQPTNQQQMPPQLQNSLGQQSQQMLQQAPQMNRPPPSMADIITQNKHNQPITPPQTTPVGTNQPPGQFYQPPGASQGQQGNFLQPQQQQTYSVNNLKSRSAPQAIDLLKEKRIIVPYEHEDEVPRPLFQHGFYTQVNCHQE